MPRPSLRWIVWPKLTGPLPHQASDNLSMFLAIAALGFGRVHLGNQPLA
jgi:hypothetical protein